MGVTVANTPQGAYFYGKIVNFDSRTRRFQLEPRPGYVLSKKLVDGQLWFHGITMIVERVNENQNTVTVREWVPVNFALQDDDLWGLHPFTPDFSLMQNSDNHNQNLFAPAFIRPVYVLGAGGKSGAGFRLNTEGGADFEADIDAGRDFVSSDIFWTVYIQGMFQGRVLADNDPNRESAHLGRSFSNSRGGAVFVETIRDYEAAASLPPNTLLRKTTTHEVGHQFRLLDNTGGIMGQGWPVDLHFVPAHLNTIRTINKP